MHSQNASTSSTSVQVVLVHGARADGSSFAKIVPLLQAKGLHVVCVQNPLTSLADDVAATHRMINAQDGPVLLAGHSYGGAIITEAGMNPRWRASCTSPRSLLTGVKLLADSPNRTELRHFTAEAAKANVKTKAA